MSTPHITEIEILQALNPENSYFLTSRLFWNCRCDPTCGNIRPHSMLMCEDCGALRDQSPDSSVAEIRAAGIHRPWTEPAITATLEEHNPVVQLR